MRKYGMIFAVLVLLGIAVGTLFFLWTNRAPSSERLEPMTVTLLKVGKADAIVIQNKDKTMVIDTGEEDDGAELTTFLTKRNISRVDVLIITHFDKDHVGGADTLMESLAIERVLIPNYMGTGAKYRDFMDALDRKGIEPQRLTEPVTFSFGDAEVLVEPPSSYAIPQGAKEYDNDFSLLTTITHGANRLFFAGDAEKHRIREWVSGESAAACDFIKIPHHGVYDKALKELVDTVKPKFAVICSSGKNPADARTLELLKQSNIRVFETKDGDVTVISDGNGLEISQKR